MDPENDYATPEKCDNQRTKLQAAIREEVEFQGGCIGQKDLDYLVRVRTWGQDSYELANFDDDELVAALRQLKLEQPNKREEESGWEADLRTELTKARTTHVDIKIPMGKSGIIENKPRLAKILWPTLLRKTQAEFPTEQAQTPVIAVLQEIDHLVRYLTAATFALSPERRDEK